MNLNLCRFAILGMALSLSAPAAGANYCLALRGNGENEPAHWGAMANLVERLGLPQMQAGGSSASITMFLTDAIASNPYIKNQSRAPERAALLFKSLQGFLKEINDTREWQDINTLFVRAKELQLRDWTKNLSDLLNSASDLGENRDLLIRTYQTGVKLGLISQESYAELFQALKRLTETNSSHEDFARDLAIAKFYSIELYNAITVLGAFNAQTDDNIFFRPGLVDFSGLARQIGRIGDFYSMLHPAAGEEFLWSAFFTTCAAPARGLTWNQLITQRPTCQAQLSQLVRSHFAEESSLEFAWQPIGVTIPSFPTTAVLTGKAHAQAVQAKKDYVLQMDPKFGRGFNIQDPEDIRFGYWGRKDLLERIDRNLDRTDEKSRRFMSLGQTNWIGALSLSPAEPGLSPLKEFYVGETQVTSAGGWSDLHPALVLRAAGCDTVVYVTRRGGESLFGQGVAKRLLGFDRPWAKISSAPETKAASMVLNNNGDPEDLTSLWSRLYNLASPKSSFKRALTNVDAVLCTNWDAYKVTNGVSEMIADSYSSPYFVRPTGRLFSEGLSPALDPKSMSSEGYPTFSGCF